MHERHLNPFGVALMAVVAGADWLAHNALTALSLVGLVISSFCQLGHLWLRWQEWKARPPR